MSEVPAREAGPDAIPIFRSAYLGDTLGRCKARFHGRGPMRHVVVIVL